MISLETLYSEAAKLVKKAIDLTFIDQQRHFIETNY